MVFVVPSVRCLSFVLFFCPPFCGVCLEGEDSALRDTVVRAVAVFCFLLAADAVFSKQLTLNDRPIDDPFCFVRVCLACDGCQSPVF